MCIRGSAKRLATFALDSPRRDGKAFVSSLDTYDTRLLAEPLSVQFPCEQHSAEFKNFLRQRPPYENLCLPEDKADQQAKEKLQKAVAAQKRFYRKYDSYTQHEWKLEREGFR